MKRRSRRNLAIADLTVATAVAAGTFGVCNAVAQEPCKLTAIGTANIAAVRDGRTLMLDDGRELPLVAIEVTDDSRDALQTLVRGRPLRLERLGGEFDCYGATPSNPCSRLCWSTAAPGYRRGSAARSEPTPY
jgi:hypothetical protein